MKHVLGSYFIMVSYPKELPTKNKYGVLRGNEKKGAEIHLLILLNVTMSNDNKT